MNIFISLIMIIMIFIIISTFGKKNKEIIFDEMQLKARNKGYRYSFLILILYNAIYSLIESAFGIVLFDSFSTASFLGLLISIFVFSFICIRENAYLGIKDNFRKKAILFLILGMSNISVGVMDLLDGNCFVDGLITFNFCTLILSLMMTFLGFYLIFKTRKDEVNKDDEEE